jgi:3-oxo-5-alpha-steroid 4-dehydrogenase 1
VTPAFRLVLWAFLAAALVTAPVLLLVSAPYGRHARRGWGPVVSARLGWFLMELPSPVIFGALVLAGPRDAATWVLFALWEVHYLHRALVWPLRLRGQRRPMPVLVMVMAITFNAFNAGLNGAWLGGLGPGYPAAWLHDPRFLAGVALFVAGYAVNQHSDRILLGLRPPGATGYTVPRGGLFRWVSCPNYLGELMEWSGFALAAWSPPALAFALWTAANLVPRALSHHRWYRQTFPDYPPERRALLPGVL